MHLFAMLYSKLDMCFWNMDAPGDNKVKYGKNLEI